MSNQTDTTKKAKKEYDDNGPNGVPFYNISSDETHYAKLPATISAYINSSDMGVNASKGQDYKWRLAPEWVKRLRQFRQSTSSMRALRIELGHDEISDINILNHLYSEQVRAWHEAQQQEETPYLDKYLDQVRG